MKSCSTALYERSTSVLLHDATELACPVIEKRTEIIIGVITKHLHLWNCGGLRDVSLVITCVCAAQFRRLASYLFATAVLHALPSKRRSRQKHSSRQNTLSVEQHGKTLSCSFGLRFSLAQCV